MLAGAGCSDRGGGGAGGGAHKAERLIAHDAARTLLAETGPPSAAEVERAAQHIDVACDPIERADYECTMGFGEELGERHGAVRTNSEVTRVRSMRCGASEAPKTYDEYVDCDSVGRVVSASDPAGDVRESRQSVGTTAAPSADAQKADLISVRVAATQERLCVQWTTRGPVEPKYGLNFWVYPNDGSRATLALSVGFEDGLPPDIGTGPYGSVTGRVGVRRNSVSLLIKRDDVAEPLRATFGQPFEFAAHTARVVGRSHPDQGYGDDLDAEASRPSYPGV